MRLHVALFVFDKDKLPSGDSHLLVICNRVVVLPSRISFPKSRSKSCKSSASTAAPGAFERGVTDTTGS